MPLEKARKTYAEVMDNLSGADPVRAAAVTHAVLALIVAERADEARASADRIAALECEVRSLRGLPDSINEALNSGDGAYRP
jgi:hypothetical protein